MQLRQKGFSFIEVITSLGILGIVSLITMNYLKDQAMYQNFSKFRFEVNTTVSLIQNHLARPSNCEQTLNGLTVSSEGSEIPEGLKSNRVDQPLLRVGDYEHFTVQNIMLKKSIYTPNSFDLVINFTPLSSKSLMNSLLSSKPKIEKRISIIGAIDTSNTVRSCNSITIKAAETLKKDFCDGLNINSPDVAIWNPETEQCKLNFSQIRCMFPDIPNGLSRLMKFTCNEFEDEFSYGYAFDFTIRSCPAKQYSVYLRPNGKYALGCPSLAEKTGPRPLLK